MHHIEIIILLLFAVMVLALVSYRYRFPFPIVLVISGLCISFVPGLPSVSLHPDVVFLVFLPPLLYGAAWNTSWHQFKANSRSIALASIGLVFFTTLCVGWVVHQMIPGFTWAQAFLLGAIISPPDAVAATSITKGLGLNPRIITLLEGESLINDASALIAYKYALGAILAGSFSIGAAGLDFVKVFSGGVIVGLLLGFVIYWVHKKWVQDSTLDVTLTFLTPFAAYLLAEKIHVSGVLAVVTAGLYLSYRAHVIFSHQSRIEAYAVWEVATFVLNSVVFVIMGLQLKEIIQGFTNTTVSQLAVYGVIISVVALIVRAVWAVPSVVMPRVLSKKIRESEAFDHRNILVFTWAGMRGIVSMAVALAIPVNLREGVPFPFRSEIIFLTFCVILFTLVVQGLSLPWLIKILKLPKHSILAEDYNVRLQLIENLKKYINEHLKTASPEVQELLHNKYKVREGLLQQTSLPPQRKPQETAATAVFNQLSELELQLLQHERSLTNDLRQNGAAGEEVLRKIEREIDLEEARLRMQLYHD